MKKAISIMFLVLAIFTTSISTSISSAESTTSNASSKVERTNFQWVVNDDLSNYEYTYEEEGISYRIVESINLETMTDVSSDIYVKENGEYVLSSKVSTKLLDDNNVLISTTKDGVITTETIPVESVDSSAPNITEGVNNAASNKISLLAGNTDLTDWTFQTITRGSNIAAKLTVAAIVVVLNHYFPYLPVKVITTVSGAYYALGTPTVYWQKQWYYRYTLTSPPLPRAERVFTYFYTNSSYTDYVYDSPVMQETYAPGWGP
ncbi:MULTISPECIES: hypothetical protein [Paenibacillus]|uniref:hypothetical protein n=1 Tax=Paenibacillus TaxID=44249 RepID=UPI00096D7397|nr:MULTISPECIES: hypothetical protein [Paenibacillus]OMD26805.1 hypothetical protein BJP48_21800 [Paenibacillus odorifer]OME06413.1 hypothetical protein BSK60_32595 [Paenibacillus odorifer]OMF86038.1 hypothetical protein BK147_30690 [Paenibacillus sp. FSL R7-0337]